MYTFRRIDKQIQGDHGNTLRGAEKYIRKTEKHSWGANKHTKGGRQMLSWGQRKRCNEDRYTHTRGQKHRF